MLLAAFITSLLLFSCSKPAGGSLDTAEWGAIGEQTFSSFLLEEEGAHTNFSGSFAVANTEEEGDIFTFLLFKPGTEFRASEISEARLFLYPIGEAKPSSLNIALAVGEWFEYGIGANAAKAQVDMGSLKAQEARQEENGWVSFDLTSFAKMWVSGERNWLGVALFGISGDNFQFASIMGDAAVNSPYVKVAGMKADRPLSYGKYPFALQPVEGEKTLGGNCLSYALRDLNMILGSDLGLEKSEMDRIYDENGVDPLTDYIKEKTEAYIGAHKEELKIANFRVIDDFNSPIDASKEYRIALRVGSYGEGAFRSFDYHYWVGLNDGTWAQKYPTGPSEIVPGTGPGVSPGAYPWDSGYLRIEKYYAYYTGKVVYFAVEKTADEFTRHRGEFEERVFE